MLVAINFYGQRKLFLHSGLEQLLERRSYEKVAVLSQKECKQSFWLIALGDMDSHERNGPFPCCVSTKQDSKAKVLFFNDPVLARCSHCLCGKRKVPSTCDYYKPAIDGV